MANALLDLLPIAVFFVAFKFGGLYTATALSILTSALQLVILRVLGTKIQPSHWISFATLLVLGGLTLLLHDERFIKWKPSVLYLAFAGALLGAPVFFGRNLIQTILSPALASHASIPPKAWRNLNLAWVLFFSLLAILNGWIALTFSTQTWVNFKLFGVTALTFLFVLFQLAYLKNYFHLSDHSPKPTHTLAPPQSKPRHPQER